MPENAVVCVIDDDHAARESLAALLRFANLEVRTFGSAQAFLEVLSNVNAGCIVTDVNMPGITGIDLLRKLHESQVKVPVIMISGRADKTVAVEAMRLGAIGFMEKPYDDEELLSRVRAAMGMNNSERA